MKKLSGTELRSLHMKRLRKRRTAVVNAGKHRKGDRSRALSNEQIATVRRYFHTHTWRRRQKRIAFELMLNLGLRLGELRVMRFGTLFGESGEVRGEVEVWGEKVRSEGRRYRRVPVSEDLRRFVEINVKFEGKSLGDYVFPSRKGGDEPRGIHNFRVWLGQSFGIIKHAEGWSGFSSHSCRKTFVTRLYKAGVRVGVIAELVGHKSVATTMLYFEDS